MSFGDGDLHDEVDRLKDVNGDLCREINRQERRIRELERMLEHDRLEIICYENDVDARDALIRDMARELRGLNDDGIPTDCMEHERRMRDLGIEVD